MRPLSEEQKDDLLELLSHQGLEPFLLTVEQLVQGFESDLLKYNSEDERKLIHLKLRAEGARALLAAIQRKVESLKTKQKA